VSRVAVLKGGRSLERQVSLRSGARVQDALQRLGHEVRPIDVGPSLVDELSGDRPEVAFVALHGRDGEDGTVQELLEVLAIPYTGSRVSACIRASDKVLAKHAMRDAGIPTPDFFAFSETAFRSSSRGTSSEMKDWRAGTSKAFHHVAQGDIEARCRIRTISACRIAAR